MADKKRVYTIGNKQAEGKQQWKTCSAKKEQTCTFQVFSPESQTNIAICEDKRPTISLTLCIRILSHKINLFFYCGILV